MDGIDFSRPQSYRTNGASSRANINNKIPSNSDQKPAEPPIQAQLKNMAVNSGIQLNSATDKKRLEADRSPISDLKSAKETLSSTNEMIFQSLSLAMLAQANATPQAYLSLLGQI